MAKLRGEIDALKSGTMALLTPEDNAWEEGSEAVLILVLLQQLSSIKRTLSRRTRLSMMGATTRRSATYLRQE
eukprot:5883932-Pyramimonas_sp.AAC.2